MRTLKIVSFLCYLIPVCIHAQSAYQDVREGNELFKSNNYSEAENSYREGIRKDGKIIESAYNLGNALYRQGKFEDAGRYFLQAANKTEDKTQKANAYHNLGNSLIKSKKLEEGIKAYKNALINNPKDEECRYNLAYAQQQLQQQQEQQEEEKKDEEKKEEQEDKENQDQDKKEEEKEEEQEKEQEEQEKEEQEKEQQQQQKEEQVSREDAERILEALNNKEKELQEKLKKQKVKEVNVNIEKDW